MEWTIGTVDTGNLFYGFIDNVVVWHSAHSSSQIARGLRYLPTRTDVAASDLWHWWPLEPIFASTQGDLSSLPFALSANVPEGQPAFDAVQAFSSCDNNTATTARAQYQNVIPPSPPVDSVWVQTLTSGGSSISSFDLTQGFILTHAFGHLNDELLMAAAPPHLHCHYPFVRLPVAAQCRPDGQLPSAGGHRLWRRRWQQSKCNVCIQSTADGCEGSGGTAGGVDDRVRSG